MTTNEFINYNFGVESARDRSCSSVNADRDGNIYSYGRHYPLLFKVAGVAFRNTRGWSSTTIRHIAWSRDQQAIDVALDDAATSKVTGPASSRSASDQEQLQEILRCLQREKDQIENWMASKKRKDTQVYRGLEHDLALVNSRIRRVQAIREDNAGGPGASNQFNRIAQVMALGDLLTDNQEESNNWKKRMLDAGIPAEAIHWPEDWDQLPEAEKESRLNKVIEEFRSN